MTDLFGYSIAVVALGVAQSLLLLMWLVAYAIAESDGERPPSMFPTLLMVLILSATAAGFAIKTAHGVNDAADQVETHQAVTKPVASEAEATK